MTFTIRPIDPVSRPFFGGEVSGIDITRPISRDDAAAIERGMDEFGVLVFHDQHFDDETQLAFSRNFGALEVHPVFAMPGTPEILPLKAENHIANRRGSANAAWHADTTMRKDPSAASILRSRISPGIGGDTVFSNMVLGYDLLDDEVKERIDGLTAFHDEQVHRARRLGYIDPSPHADRHRCRCSQRRAHAACRGTHGSLG